MSQQNPRVVAVAAPSSNATTPSTLEPTSNFLIDSIFPQVLLPGLLPFAVGLYSWYKNRNSSSPTGNNTHQQSRRGGSNISTGSSQRAPTPTRRGPLINNTPPPTTVTTTSLQDAISLLSKWQLYHLAIDVGASNIRLAFQNPLTGELIMAPKRECGSMTQLLTVVAEVDVLLGEHPKVQAEAACLAFAGPISGDTVTITNYDPKDCSIHKNDLPPKLFPRGRTYFLNDLEACSFGVVRMGLRGDLWEYVAPKGKAGDKSTLENQHYVVLAMGTGLGASLVYAVHIRAGADVPEVKFDVMPLELGHIFMGHELSQDDRDRLDFIAQKAYGSKFAPEIEDICSGRGLIACYEYEIRNQQERKSLRAREIAQLVLEGDEFAQRAMHAHYRYLYKAAQTMCVLVPQCKGVFLCGDNQVINEPFVLKHLPDFEKEFYENHPRKEWLRDVVIHRQVRGLNMNVQGALYYIDQNLGQ